MIRYSESTGNFYPYDMDYPNLPDDIVDVSKSAYNAAMARPNGASFHFCDGELIITEAKEESFEEKAAQLLSPIRADREVVLNRISGIGWAAYDDGDDATVAAVIILRKKLLLITSSDKATVAESNGDFESYKEAIKSSISEIKKSIPVSLLTAFNGTNL